MSSFQRVFLHHDVDVTAFGRQRGEVPGMPCVFQPDAVALKQVEAILQDSKQPISSWSNCFWRSVYMS